MFEDKNARRAIIAAGSAALLGLNLLVGTAFADPLGMEELAPEAASTPTYEELQVQSDEPELEAQVSSAGGAAIDFSQYNVNCVFTIDAEGTLVIGPTSGNSSCTFCAIPEYIFQNEAGKIKAIRFEKGVKAYKHFAPFVHLESFMYRSPMLQSFDMSNVDTSDVTDLGGAFVLANGTLNVAMDTSKVTNMASMFYGATPVNFVWNNNYDARNVTNMQSMFTNSTFVHLKSGIYNSNKVTNMQFMFANMRVLKELDIDGLDNTNADCSNMFKDTNSIEKFVVGKEWDTSKPGALPTSSVGKWWSLGAKRWMTNDEIAATRSHVADTYTVYRFPDVPADAWYAEVVARAADMGIINGYDDGKFGPNDSITRGQVSVILWNLAGDPAAGKGAKAFPDVKSGAYYEKAVAWASSAGVVSGYTNGKFGPNDEITREQLAAMLSSYASRVAGKTVEGSASDFASMKDAGTVSPWAVKSVGFCVRSKIISGTKDGRVNPKGNAARAEAAKMIVFMHDLLK